MSEDKIENQDDLKGGSRRSRKDEQGRDFICGCGKKYLSYPALYTHIKTKHQGHQPEGTQKTGLAPLNRRTKQKLDEKLLKDIQSWVSLQNLKILGWLDENAVGNVPASNRIKKQQVGREIFEAYLSILKTPILTLDKKSSLESVLMVYLIGAGQYVSEPMFQYYSVFSRLFRNCYNEHGVEIFDACFKIHEEHKNKTLSVEECKFVPVICDFFIRFYVPFQLKDEDMQAALEYICFDFCQWMYQKKLTSIEVTVVRKNQELRKNLIDCKGRDKKSETEKQNPSENREDEKEQRNESQEQHSSSSELEKKNSHENEKNGNKVSIERQESLHENQAPQIVDKPDEGHP